MQLITAKIMKEKLLLCGTMALFLLFCMPSLLQAQLPDPSWFDTVGDGPHAPSDYQHGWFVQQGESLVVGFSMVGQFVDRDPVGWCLSSFNVDEDLDPNTGQFCGNEYNIDFHDYGGGNWFGSQYLMWNLETSGFTKRVLLPVTVHEDGKTMTCKVSLVGTDWEEVSYTISEWYKAGNAWHDVEHLHGDKLDEWGKTAREVALAGYTWNHQADKLLSFVESIQLK